MPNDPPIDRADLQDLHDVLDRLSRRLTRRTMGTMTQMQMDAGTAMSMLHRAPIAHRHQLSSTLPTLLREIGARRVDTARHFTALEAALDELRERLRESEGRESG
jgi:hypothetical protein